MGNVPLKTLLAFVLLAPWAVIHAQNRPSAVVRIAGNSIDSAFTSIAATPGEFLRELPIGDKNSYQFVVLSRWVMGPAEVHDHWADIVFVRSGSATLRTGMRLIDRKPAEEGEWRGTAISDQSEERAQPGDVLIIPAGVAHQWQPQRGAPFSYVVLKVHLAQRSKTR